jgi:Domain of unknown function (DUF4350)
MRERFLTMLCALGALLLFGTLFLRRDSLDQRLAARPTSVERSDNGQLGAFSWLQAEGVRVLSLRQRFGALLHRQDLSGNGNLLIVTLPAATNFRNDELIALDRWVRDGNTLLVMAAWLDGQGWARDSSMLSNDLRLVSGLDAAAPEDDKKPQQAAPGRAGAHGAPPKAHLPRARSARPQQVRRSEVELKALSGTVRREVLVPNRAHPYFEGVSQAIGFSDYLPVRGELTGPRDGFALSLAHVRDSQSDGFWVRPNGSGTIIVSGLGTLFTNRALGVADNARLLANLVAMTVGPRGSVIFDDQHQGLSLAYDPQKFYADSRLYATLAIIGAVWLTWVLGGTQLRMPSVRTPAPREAALVRTTGLFLARVVRPAAAARRMLEQFVGRLRQRLGNNGADTDELWQWLEDHPRLARADVLRLRGWQAAASAGRRVPLAELHNLIVRTERQLAA